MGSQRRRDDRFAIYNQVGIEPRTASRVDYEVSGNVADIMPGAPNLLYPPKPAGWDTAGFVEAQNGDGKINEIESSVVWRARLALRSASQAIAQQEIEISSRELAKALQLARISQIGSRDSKFDLFKDILRRTKDLVFTVTVFHPMVVVDADLWGVSPTDEISVQHARVHLTGVSRYPYYWFDLVKREAVLDVISVAQDNYDRQAHEKGLVPAEPEMGWADYEIAYP